MDLLQKEVQLLCTKLRFVFEYKLQELRRYQVFNYFTWMGGVYFNLIFKCYGTPTLGGSKCGA
jgi:hypothetical protein